MKRIQVVLLELPHMLRDIVTGAIGKQPDMEIAATLTTREALADAARPRAERPVDVVLLGVDGAVQLDREAALLYDWPRARLIAVSVRDAETVVLELRPHADLRGNVSLDELLTAIRRGGVDDPAIVVDVGPRAD